MSREDAFKVAYEEYKEFAREAPSAMGLRAAIDAYTPTLTEENARLLQENKAMREALKPFARISIRPTDHYTDGLATFYADHQDGGEFTVEDVRRARTILTQGEGK